MAIAEQSIRIATDATKLDALLSRLVASGEEDGVQVAAYLDGQCVIDSWAGFADRDAGTLVDGDTLFNIYSVGKPVAAVALHMLVERGLADYQSRVAEFWPEYAANGKETTTLRDVLTHRAGIPQMPEGVTPELMCDNEWMTRAIAALTPVAPPGTRALYQSMTFGWIVSELVRRIDPEHRAIGAFIRDEITGPLGANDFWVGLPPELHHRVAKGSVAPSAISTAERPPLYSASLPKAVELAPAVFQRPQVMSTQLPGVGAISNARSCARFWAMLAQGGALDGVRLLSEELVATFNTPRANVDEPDEVMFGGTVPISIAGFWLGGPASPVAAAKHRRVICHPSAGNSFAFADLGQKFAIAICHNRMQVPRSREQDYALAIADTAREILGID